AQTSGTPAVNLINANAATAVFAAPDVGPAGTTLGFTLTVTANGKTATATTTVQVNNVNHPPTASAGADQSAAEGTLVLRQGSGSEPDGDPLTFAWTQVAPASPIATLNTPSSASTTLTTPSVAADTAFLFQLAVSDGVVTTPVTATTTVTVRHVNLA